MRFQMREHGVVVVLLACAGFVWGLGGDKPAAAKPMPVQVMPAIWHGEALQPVITNTAFGRRGACANGQCGVAATNAAKCVAGCKCPAGECVCEMCPIQLAGHETRTSAGNCSSGRCGIFSGVRERISGRIDRRQGRRAGRRG